MELERLSGSDRHLSGLLSAVRYWHRLDAAVKQLLPPNLQAHFQVVCIDGGALMVHAYAPMAATRLKMVLPQLLPALQELDGRIERLQIKVRPRPPEPQRSKNFHIGPQALAGFEQTADRLQHYPELAAAIRQLVANQRR